MMAGTLPVISGFVVEHARGMFLDCNRERWLTHSPKETPFVHLADRLMADVFGQVRWTLANGLMVYAGKYDPSTKSSVVTGPAMTFMAFVNTQLGKPADLAPEPVETAATATAAE